MGTVEAMVSYASIDKPNFADRGFDRSPHLVALQFLTEKIQKWVKGQAHPLANRVLLVADENHEQEQYAIDLILDMQAQGGPFGHSLGLAVPLDNFVDSIYFARSERSRGIQLADLVAFIYRTRPSFSPAGTPPRHRDRPAACASISPRP